MKYPFVIFFKSLNLSKHFNKPITMKTSTLMLAVTKKTITHFDNSGNCQIKREHLSIYKTGWL